MRKAIEKTIKEEEAIGEGTVKKNPSRLLQDNEDLKKLRDKLNQISSHVNFTVAPLQTKKPLPTITSNDRKTSNDPKRIKTNIGEKLKLERKKIANELATKNAQELLEGCNTIEDVNNFLRYFHLLSQDNDALRKQQLDFVNSFLDQKNFKKLQVNLMQNLSLLPDILKYLPTKVQKEQLIKNINIRALMAKLKQNESNGCLDVDFLLKLREFIAYFSGISLVQFKNLLNGAKIAKSVKNEDDAVKALLLLIDKPDELEKFIQLLLNNVEKKQWLTNIINNDQHGLKSYLDDCFYKEKGETIPKMEEFYQDSSEQELQKGYKIISELFQQPNTKGLNDILNVSKEDDEQKKLINTSRRINP